MTISNSIKEIDWKAAGTNRILQNVRNLINTFTYEIPFHRTMGIPGALIDLPAPELANELCYKLQKMLETYEPRAKVKDVQCTFSQDGSPIVEVVLQ